MDWNTNGAQAYRDTNSIEQIRRLIQPAETKILLLWVACPKALVTAPPWKRPRRLTWMTLQPGVFVGSISRRGPVSRREVARRTWRFSVTIRSSIRLDAAYWPPWAAAAN